MRCSRRGDRPSMSGANRSALLSPITAYLQQLHATYARVQDGNVASYIPELSRANPNWFGICLATTDGQVYEVGDTRQPFTIQSISKPFVYGLVLEDHGKDAVLQKIGVEPSGDAFNSISLYPDSGRPFNPMINAGAIATTGLVRGVDTADRLRRILRMFGRYSGQAKTVDHLVYQSEKSTGHRNRAIGHMLRNFAILADDPEPVLDLYFQQCAITVTCRDLAVMAATLANGGLNPLTGQRAVRQEPVESILSIMSTCGMYDSAGEWIYKVGMPAKSGVAGGILAVLPGQLGIGVFSPRLDTHGNSVRGIHVCQELSQMFNLHLFNAPVVTKSVIRTRYDATQINARRVRAPQMSRVLQQQGKRIRVYELQGNLVFSTVEVVIRDIISSLDAVDFVILDLKRVTRFDAIACHLLRQLLQTVTAQQCILLFSHVDRTSPFVTYILGQVGTDGHHGPLLYADHDFALEWCEDQLLACELGISQADAILPLAEHQRATGSPSATYSTCRVCSNI